MEAETEKLTKENEILKEQLMEEKVTLQQLRKENEELKNAMTDLQQKSVVECKRLAETTSRLIQVLVELNELRVNLNFRLNGFTI